jgi:hypothetical protein
MKALTLTQPWASLVAIAAKQVETRSWQTRYRGALAIHAARGFPPGARALCGQEPYRAALRRAGYAEPDRLPLGAVVATCRLVGCLPTVGRDGLPPAALPELGTAERAFGDYRSGRFLWLLADVQPVEPPQPARGRLGMWEWGE